MSRPWEQGSFSDSKTGIDDIFLEKRCRSTESMATFTRSMMGIERKVRQRKVILIVSADWARRILMKVSLLLALENIDREIPLSFTEC